MRKIVGEVKKIGGEVLKTVGEVRSQKQRKCPQIKGFRAFSNPLIT